MSFTPLQKAMVGHACLILFVALLAGIGLLMSLIGGVELVPGSIITFDVPGNNGAWARAHVGGMLNATLVLLMAIVARGLDFPAAAAQRLAWIFVGTGWANTVFYWAALFAPNRALTIASNRFGESNLATFVGYAPALLFAVLSMVGAAMVAKRAFAKG